MSDRKNKIQTVCGLIEPRELGLTLTHEHLMLHADSFFTPPSKASDQNKTQIPFTMENLGWIRQNPYSYKPNLNFSNEHETIIQELNDYKSFGGRAIVENSTIGLHRDVAFLHKLSTVTGVHVISGTGYYVEPFQTESTRQMSQEALAAQIREDICSGVKGTDICCGVIGEVGCSWPLTDFEKRSVRSAAVVQSELGSPAIFHPGRNSEAPFEIMRIFLEAGGLADKTVMSHLDRAFPSTEQLLEFAKLGCYCEYDLFGIETSYYQLNDKVDMPSDAQRVVFLRALLDNGYGSRILMAQDIHTKHRLKKYGGHGFSHVLENVVPHMKRRSFTDEDIKMILTDNPAAWLTFTK